MADNWLDIEPPKDMPAPALPPALKPPVLNPRRQQIALLKRKLPLSHRVYAACLLEARLNNVEALRLMREKGYQQSAQTLGAWRRKPYFKQLVDLMGEEFVETVGSSAAKVLLQVDAIAEYGSEKIVARDKYGAAITDETGTSLSVMRDPHLALKASELLGKKHKLWGADDGNARVVINLVDLTGKVNIAEVGEKLDIGADAVDGELVGADSG